MVTSRLKSDPLRVAIFTGIFPAVSETFILRQITGLIDLGHTVDIFSDTRPDPAVPIHPDVTRYRLLDRITYMDMPPETSPWEMPLWPLTGRTWPPGSEKSIHNSVRLARALPKFLRCFTASPRLALKLVRNAEYGYRARSFSQAYRMARLTKKRDRYDVLHAHFGPVAESFRFARELWGVPLVASFHGYDFTTVPRKEGKNVYVKLFATADGIIANSHFTRTRLMELGCPDEKIHKLPTGLDPTRFPFRERSKAPSEPVRVLVIARLVPIKGIAFALEASAKIHQKHSDIQLDIVGDGPLRPELEKLSSQLGLANVVRFRGALAGESLQELMNAAHIFLHLSVSVEGDAEGQGLVLQEAQAAGLPIIATRHGAFPEGVLDGQSAFLVPERDPISAAERLVYLIEHPEIWPIMGRKGRAFVEENFDVRQLNQSLADLYHEVIRHFPHP